MSCSTPSTIDTSFLTLTHSLSLSLSLSTCPNHHLNLWASMIRVSVLRYRLLSCYPAIRSAFLAQPSEVFQSRFAIFQCGPGLLLNVWMKSDIMTDSVTVGKQRNCVRTRRDDGLSVAHSVCKSWYVCNNESRQVCDKLSSFRLDPFMLLSCYASRTPRSRRSRNYGINKRVICQRKNKK